MTDNRTLIKQTLVGMLQVQKKNNIPEREFVEEVVDFLDWLQERSYITRTEFFKVFNEAVREGGRRLEESF
jgi:hypothetical protein